MRYTAVDDVGRAVNPLIIHGQTHGGIAQGVGQALLEHCPLRSASGQLLSGLFMDYAMPRAHDFPFFTTEISEVPSTTHPLGMRPAGEGGTTPALAVVVNAVVDALSGFGVRPHRDARAAARAHLACDSRRAWRSNARLVGRRPATSHFQPHPHTPEERMPTNLARWCVAWTTCLAFGGGAYAQGTPAKISIAIFVAVARVFPAAHHQGAKVGSRSRAGARLRRAPA